MTYPRRAVQLGPSTNIPLLFHPWMGFFSCCHGNCQLSLRCECVFEHTNLHSGCVLRLKIQRKSNLPLSWAQLVLTSSYFFFFLQFSPDTQIRVIGFQSRETILGLVGSNQLLYIFFFFSQFFPETQIRVIGFQSRERQGSDSQSTALVTI